MIIRNQIPNDNRLIIADSAQVSPFTFDSGRFTLHRGLWTFHPSRLNPESGIIFLIRDYYS